MAAALYSKLQGMIKELKNWKIESPANQLFDKTERFFTKVSHRITEFASVSSPFGFGSFLFQVNEFDLKRMIKNNRSDERLKL